MTYILVERHIPGAPQILPSLQSYLLDFRMLDFKLSLNRSLHLNRAPSY